MRGDHDLLLGLADPWAVGGYMVWEHELFASERHVDIAERYSRRLHPQKMDTVESSRQRAKERDELKIAFPAISFPPSDLSLALL
jgi:hypothetical protein